MSKEAPERIRELRQAQTEAEQRLWRLLRHRRFQGFKFRRQLPFPTGCLHRIPSPQPSPRGRGGKRDANHTPLPLGEGGRRPGEGTPITRRVPSLPFPTGCLHWIPSPQPSPRGRGGKRDANHTPLPLGEGGRRPGEGTPITRAFLPCRSQRAACTGHPHPNPLSEGEGARGMRIIPLSLWERVAEGRVRAPPITRDVPSLPFPTGCLHWIPSPQPSPRGRGGKRDANHTPLPLGEGGRRPGEGTPNNPGRSFPAVPNGVLTPDTLTPTLSRRERG